MGCRIGMATNVAGRVQELKDKRLVPLNVQLRVLRSQLTYYEANSFEQEARAACGLHCQGQEGGRYVVGPVWSVYRLDW